MSNEIKKDAKVIPNKITEMADFIKECDTKGAIPIIIQKRQWGRVAAERLARQTEDVDFIVIEPKQIENEREIL